MVVAAGDNGSADCSDVHGNVLDALAVDYPSASPWVTSVGGTNVHLDPGNRIAAQEVWNDTSVQLAAGGGGLSALFVRPPFQNGVVAPNRRSVPDLAMLADIAPGYTTYCTASSGACRGWRTVGGTSAASPLLAGGLAIVDQDLEAHHRAQLGLANPLLYSLGRASAGVFSDVTQGSNDVGPYIPDGDGHPLGCCTAVGGFDDASGWGSPNLAALDRTALVRLPRTARATLSIPRGQQPVKAGRLAARLSCSKGCTAYAFGFASIAGGPTLALRSGRYRFGRAGTKVVTIRFSPSQERRLRVAVARRRRITFELFGAALDARRAVGFVSPGRAIVII
jgi:kumamolisin